MKRENLLIACVLLAAVVLAGCGPLAPVGRNVAGTAPGLPGIYSNVAALLPG